MSLTVTVYGTPAPQGSKRHVGNGVMVESSKAVKPWREAVKHAILAARVDDFDDSVQPPMDGPVRAELIFTVRKPASAPKRRRTWPAKRPDLDKLIRATLDAVKDAGAIRDDAQIVELVASKVYPGDSRLAPYVPGAWIRLTPIGNQP